MLRSMFAAVSGLRNHQVRMDVIGHNIANVNTHGFKRSRVTFQEALSQTMRGASRPGEGRGGTNPMQVGLGMNIGAIDTFHTQGSPEGTGRTTDLAIDGAGFFILRGVGESHLYTRAGAFGWDGDGTLVNGAGLVVRGQRFDPVTREWALEISDIKLFGEDKQAPPRQTGEVVFTGNLAADADAGSGYVRSITVYDQLGVAKTVTFRFTKDENTANTWNWTATWDGGSAQGQISFQDNGKIVEEDGLYTMEDFFGQDMDLTLDFSALTQYAAEGESYMELTQDGYTKGDLVEVFFDTGGVITGVYSNGESRPLYRLVLANFANPEGLNNLGNTLFSESNNSGPAQIGVAGQGSLGAISPSSLEMSNVDLAQEFTDMIITQRGFQANSRIITTSDELLQELVNLKR
ncbi:MAG: flagellar hook protein FlgE [Bacillota bacterium]|nr:flagellar hook protein FlgE [Bacillota bacterium]